MYIFFIVVRPFFTFLLDLFCCHTRRFSVPVMTILAITTGDLASSHTTSCSIYLHSLQPLHSFFIVDPTIFHHFTPPILLSYPTSFGLSCAHVTYLAPHTAPIRPPYGPHTAPIRPPYMCRYPVPNSPVGGSIATTTPWPLTILLIHEPTAYRQHPWSGPFGGHGSPWTPSPWGWNHCR